MKSIPFGPILALVILFISGCQNVPRQNPDNAYKWSGAAIEVKHKTIFKEPLDPQEEGFFGYGWIIGWTLDRHNQLLWGFTVPDKQTKAAKYEIEAWVPVSQMSIIPGQRGQVKNRFTWDPEERQWMRSATHTDFSPVAQDNQGVWTYGNQALSPQPLFSEDNSIMYLNWHMYQPGFQAGDPLGVMAVDREGILWITQTPKSREPVTSWSVKGEDIILRQSGLVSDFVFSTKRNR